MKAHRKYSIKWHGFPENQWRKTRGVYMIGDEIYVGASTHIRRRIIEHCKCSFDKLKSINRYPHLYRAGRLKLKPLDRYILNKLLNGKSIDVFLLSSNPYDEKIYIEAIQPISNSPNGRTYDELF